MSTATPPTLIPYERIARDIARRPAGGGGARVVGVDGPSGSGKSTVARGLLPHLPGATLIEIDDFVSWVDFDGWWPRFAAEVVAPLSRGRDARYRVRDWAGDEFGTGLDGWKTARWAPFILVEGVTCTRRAAAGFLSYAVWVEAPAALRLARGLARDGAGHRDLWRRWMAREERFFAGDGARDRADLVVDAAAAVPHDPSREVVVVRRGPAQPAVARVRVAAPLRFLMPARHRREEVLVPVDGASTALHLVESLGVPRTEIGGLRVGGRPAAPGERPAPGDVVEVSPVPRPQRPPAADPPPAAAPAAGPMPADGPRFLLDVHLGTLARRMRLLGLDTAYRPDAADAELVARANAEGRVLLTQDRGLLRRRALAAGAYVRGAGADAQLADVLDRFDPPLAPWTRCPACNGPLAPVPKAEVLHLLEPGTRRSYADFSRCAGCGRPYWRGAHAARLAAIVDRAARRG